jgi:hypothetical protein
MFDLVGTRPSQVTACTVKRVRLDEFMGFNCLCFVMWRDFLAELIDQMLWSLDRGTAVQLHDHRTYNVIGHAGCPIARLNPA